MAVVTSFIKDALGAQVDASTLKYQTNGTDVTITSNDQYTYFATATIAGTLDGHEIEIGENRVLTLAKYNEPNEDWTGKFAFRTEGYYESEEYGKVYGFLTLGSGDIEGTVGNYTAVNQVLGTLTFSNINVYRVLTSDLNDTAITSAWFSQQTEEWKTNHNVTQDYFDTVKEMDLATSLALNTNKLAAKQTFNSVEATVADASDPLSTINGINMNSQYYSVENVSQYQGSNLNEIITLKQGSVNVQDDEEIEGNKFVSSVDDKTYTLKSYALAGGGDDTVYGTLGVDWINGQDGNDTLFGGSAGHDMISGGIGNDTIVAGAKVTRKEATGSDDGVNLKSGYALVDGNTYVKLNTTTTELYGDDGNDVIYSGKGNDFIWAEKGNDEIYLNGGSNTLLYTNVAYDSEGFGSDTIQGFSQNDKLEFFVSNANNTKFYGYALTDLTFGQSEYVNNKADLIISADEGANKITIKDFYKKENETLIPNKINLNVLSQTNLTDAIVGGAPTHSSTSSVTVQYSTDGKIYVDNVSDYQGANGFSEVVTLKKAAKAINSVIGADGKTYSIFAAADFTSNTESDFAQGTASNDVLIGGNGNDILLGGTAGHDIILGGNGDDEIAAGSIVTRKEATGSDDGVNLKAGYALLGANTYVKLNTTGSELKGGNGTDIIYSSKGNDFISGNGGNDTIYLNGGSNTLLFSENNFGTDTVYNATSKDVLQFFDDGSGTLAADLTFSKLSDSNNLTISNNNAASVVIDKFFDGANIDKFIAGKTLNGENYQETYSILKDAVINVTLADGITAYEGTKYNEAVTLGTTNATFTMGSGNNTINVNVGTMAAATTINLTKGENLNIVFNAADAGEEVIVAGITYDAANKNDLILDIGGKKITVKSYLSGKSGANVQLNGKDMYQWSTISAGFNNLSAESTISAAEAMDKNGRVTGSDMSDFFDMQNYISDSQRGVTITSGAGDDTVEGSNYNDTVTIRSGNNKITQSEGTNRITTGAGNDTFIAQAGGSSNTANLGDGNNNVQLNNVGTNRVTTGKGNDTFNLNDGSNTVSAGAGNNEFVVSGGINKLTSTTGNDYYNLTAGENTIRSGAGSDVFDITSGVNKINATGKKTETAVANITGGINNIVTGTSNDIYNINALSNNTINSGAGDDEFNVNVGSNNINAGAGDDILNINDGVAASVNIVDMGAGADTVIINTLTGLNGRNSVKLGAGDDFITVGDAITATNSSNTINNIDAGAGIDTITLYNGSNTVNAGAGNDIVAIYDGNNVIAGGAGNDTFNVTGGLNTILGGAGNDTYNFAAGLVNGTFNGGAGNDTYNFAGGQLITPIGNLVVSDNSGTNIINLAADDNTKQLSLYVDFALNDKGKAVLTGNATLTERDNDDVSQGLALSGLDKAASTKVNIGAVNIEKFTITKNAVNSIAQTVAGWLNTYNGTVTLTGFDSTADLIANGSAADKLALCQQFDNASAQYIS